MSVNITDMTDTIDDGFQIVKSKKLSKKKRVSTQSSESKCETTTFYHDHSTDLTKSHLEIKKSKDNQKPTKEIYHKDEQCFLHGESVKTGSPSKSSWSTMELSKLSRGLDKPSSPNRLRVSGPTESGMKLLQNKKRVLCYSYVTRGECPYGIKCVYAHSIKEQNIDPLRKKVYDILNNNIPLNDIDFVHDNELYKTFLQLTRTCYGCENNMCVGGYNCKKGAINLEHTICYDDMYNGECQYGDTCDKIHLTKRRLVPKTIQLLIMTGYNESDKNSYVKKLINVTRSATGTFRPVESNPTHSVTEQYNAISGMDPTMSNSTRRIREMLFITEIGKSSEYIKTHNKCVDDDTLSVESYESLESHSSDDCDKYILILQPI